MTAVVAWPRGVTVAVPDGRLALWERGSGPTVVLVHGGTATAAHDWAAVVDDLARDHRVVLADQRGHGASTDVGGELALRRFSADLPHLLRRVGTPRAVFVGLSMGANAVLHLLVRDVARARGAVLVGGSSTGDPDRVRRMAAGAWPDSLRALRHDVDRAPDYWDRLRGVLLDDWARNTEVPEAALARVTCPVLVVRGADDAVQSATVTARLAEGLPQATTCEIPGAGHAVPVDQPAAFLVALRAFLAEHARDGG